MRSMLAVMMIICLVSAATHAHACSCRTPTADDLMSSAAAILTGVATETIPATLGESITTFEVVEGFKGVTAGQVVRIRHGSGSSASCGIRFTVGESHTVAAYKEQVGTSLFASLCSVYIFTSPGGGELIERLRAIGGPTGPALDIPPVQ